MSVITLDQLVAELAVATASVDAKTSVVERAAAAAVLADAKSRVPVRTGRLRDSLEASESPEGGMEVGSGLDYAAFVENGTYKDAPQPYLGPAADKGESILATGVLAAGVF